jgi:hypothetical protein
MKISEDVYPTVIAGKTIGPKVALFSAVLKERLEKLRSTERKRLLRPQVKKILKAMNNSVEKRNVVVHGLWSPGGHGDSLWTWFNLELSEAPIAASSKKNPLKVAASELSGLAGTFDQLSDSVRGAYWEFFIPRVRKRKAKKE